MRRIWEQVVSSWKTWCVLRLLVQNSKYQYFNVIYIIWYVIWEHVISILKNQTNLSKLKQTSYLTNDLIFKIDLFSNLTRDSISEKIDFKLI